MSVSYSSNFKCPVGEPRKNQEMMDTDYYLQQNHHQSCGLTRYRSAPGSVLENLVDGTSGVIASDTSGFEAYGDIRSSSREMETFFMLPCNGSGNSECNDMQEYEYEEKSVKQEELLYRSSSTKVMYQSSPVQSWANGNTVSVANSAESSFGHSSSLGLEKSMQPKLGNGNSSNPVRQSSSPAQIFSNLGVDHDGFNVIRKVSNFRACNGEPTSTGRLYNNHISISSGPMPRISEVENKSVRVSGPENGSLGNGNGSNGRFFPNLMTDSWNNASLIDLRRARENDGDLFCGLSRSQTQNRDCRDGSTALTHLSLPKTCAEMDVVEKLWQFQGSVPCKVRAKRGCATHPRSIAERVRRTRISERMRKLQGLFPNMDKQTNTADMLDMAVEYIKDLQKQIKTLTDTKAKCSC